MAKSTIRGRSGSEGQGSGSTFAGSVTFEGLYELGISLDPYKGYPFLLGAIKPSKKRPFYADFKSQRKPRNHLFKAKGANRGR